MVEVKQKHKKNGQMDLDINEQLVEMTDDQVEELAISQEKFIDINCIEEEYDHDEEWYDIGGEG